jgi:uncharacterized protein DUF4399
MKTGSREWGAVLVGALLALGACGRAPAPMVRITEPADGATVAGPRVRVLLEAAGVEIAPAAEQRQGTAHHHLFFDVDVTPLQDTIPAGVTGIIHLGRAQTEFTFDSVAPGAHRVIAVLADPWHVPIKPPAMDTVRITVGP